MPFDFHNNGHQWLQLNTVYEVRLGTGIYYWASSRALAERASHWEPEIDDLLRQNGGNNRRLRLDRADPVAVVGLYALGIEVMEYAGRTKSTGEIQCMRAAITVCEAAMHEMWVRLAPSMTGNALWSILHQANITRGGERRRLYALVRDHLAFNIDVLKTGMAFREFAEKHFSLAINIPGKPLFGDRVWCRSV